MLYLNLINYIINILAENGETRALSILKLINSYVFNLKVPEPLVFDHIPKNTGTLRLRLGVYNMPDTRRLQFCKRIRGRVLIDWGDGKINKYPRHVYLSCTKKYRVKIYNNSLYALIFYVNEGWANEITDFISIGRIRIKSLSCMFAKTLFNGKIHPNWNTANIVSIGAMFSNNTKFNQKFGDNWDTSNITSMGYVFNNAHNFNQKFGDNWDTSRVTDMSSMFSGALNFNQKIGDNWDTSNVEHMSFMFYKATKFNQKISDSWDTSKVRDMSYMFYNAINFNQKIGDNWDTSQVTDMSYMFAHAHGFNQKIGNSWNVSKVNNMTGMFEKAISFNQKIGDNWDMSGKYLTYMFRGATNLEQEVGKNWDLYNASTYDMFVDTKISKSFNIGGSRVSYRCIYVCFAIILFTLSIAAYWVYCDILFAH